MSTSTRGFMLKTYLKEQYSTFKKFPRKARIIILTPFLSGVVLVALGTILFLVSSTPPDPRILSA